MTTHIVTASALNLRSRPDVRPSTRMAVLDQGTEVTKLGNASVAGWWEIEVSIGGSPVKGVVASRFLLPVGDPGLPDPTKPTGPGLPEAHLSRGKSSVKRSRDGGRAHPLGEVGMPSRSSGTASEKGSVLVKIVKYLDSDKSSHLRYKPKSRDTFCNIYAHDYCYLAGTYLPRVFWKSSAVTSLRSGTSVAVRYGQTVNELNANMLHDWFQEFSDEFGWKQETDLTALQDAANAGEVCIIVGQKKKRNRSGHIVAVVPENDGNRATRTGGRVTRPLQSQAGRVNFRFKANRRWWQDDSFGSFGFWRHP